LILALTVVPDPEAFAVKVMYAVTISHPFGIITPGNLKPPLYTFPPPSLPNDATAELLFQLVIHVAESSSLAAG
jgi:hypothetical protein